MEKSFFLIFLKHFYYYIAVLTKSNARQIKKEV